MPWPGVRRLPGPSQEVEDNTAGSKEHHQTLQPHTSHGLLPAVAQSHQLQRDVPPEVDEVDAGGSSVEVLEAVVVPGVEGT